jgi:hypothetical protein
VQQQEWLAAPTILEKPLEPVHFDRLAWCAAYRGGRGLLQSGSTLDPRFDPPAYATHPTDPPDLEGPVKFMLMMNAKRGKGDWGVMDWSQADLKAHIAFMKRFAGELKDSGRLVGAEGLAAPAQAKVVRAKSNGTPEVTDGPFPEAKEFLAGYWIVDVETPEEAYDIAARASAAPGPGGVPLNMPIEVREVMSAPPVEV